MRAVVKLVAENLLPVPVYCARGVVKRLRKSVGGEQLQSLRETTGQAHLKRVVGGLGGGLNLDQAGDVGTLIRCSQEGVRRRVGCYRLSGYGINNRLLRAGELRLVDVDAAEQVAPSCAYVGDFEQQVMRERVLKAGVVLMEIRRAHETIKRVAGEVDARDERGELVLRRQWEERVLQVNQRPRRTPANGVGRRRNNRDVYVKRGGARIVDAVPAPQRQAPRIERRVGQGHARSKVIRVNGR